MQPVAASGDVAGPSGAAASAGPQPHPIDEIDDLEDFDDAEEGGGDASGGDSEIERLLAEHFGALDREPAGPGTSAEDEEAAAITRALQAQSQQQWRARGGRGGAGPSSSVAAAAEGGEGGDDDASQASLLGSLFAKLQAGKEVVTAAVGQHVKVGQKSSLAARRANEIRQAKLAQGGSSKLGEKQSMRKLRREEQKLIGKEQREQEAKRVRAKAKKEEEEREAAMSAGAEAFRELLRRFAEACGSGDRGALHLLIHNLLSETNLLIASRRGLPTSGLDLPWSTKTLPDFFDACFAVSIRATGSIAMVNEIEQLAKEAGQPFQFASLVGCSARDEETWRAKRALVHEWIEKGYYDVLRKALSLAPLCIRSPSEPPLVTALRAGHDAKLLQLLVDPVFRRRKNGVDEASPTDGATAFALAIQLDRADALREILKHSLHWSLTVDGRTWTPLCYALAQGRSAMVGLLLAHAKRVDHAKRNRLGQCMTGEPLEFGSLADYVNAVCDGSTALYRAVAANAPDMVRLLLATGADPAIRCRDARGRATSALHLAAQHEEQQPLLELLLSHVPADRRASVLSTLADGGGHSLLHVAVARLHVPLARLLLGMGARPTSQSEGRSPLLRLLRKLQPPGQEQAAAAAPAAEEQQPEQGQEAEAAPSEADAASAAASDGGDAGESSDAAAARQLEAAFLEAWQPEDTAHVLHPEQRPADAALLRAWLLAQRATTLDPALADASSARALGQAAVEERNLPLLELLLEQPAFSAQGLHLHRLVGRRGAPAYLLAALLDRGAEVMQREPGTEASLLHRAAEEADLPALELLLARGADPQAVDSEGNNALHAVAGQKERAGVSYAAVVARLYEVAPQLLTRRNTAFFLPSDRAPVGSAVEAQLEALTRRELDAAAVAEEAERWERAARDLSLVGPPTEDTERKQQRIAAMLHKRLRPTVQAIERAEKAGLAGSGLERADSATSSAAGVPVARGAAGAAGAAAVTALAPATPLADAIYRQRPRKRPWADLADELPPVVRLPVWPESLEAAAAAARADPAAAVAAILAAATPEGTDPVSSLSELPWGMDIHRDAWVEWAGLEARHRRRVLSLLLRLAGGRLGSDPRAGQVKRVRTEGGPDFEHIEVYVARLPRSATVVFEVAPEVDVRRSVLARPAGGGGRLTVERQYHEILRIWCVSLEDVRVRECLEGLAASYRKGRSARHQLLLEAQPLPRQRSGGPAGAQAPRLPLDFRCREVARALAEQAAAEAAAAAAAAGKGGRGVRRYFPPASTDPDSYTVIKFHPLDDGMLHAVMTNEAQADVDFQFRLSPEETEIIERQPRPPQSLILLGRSGTGKTTCAVFRMFDRWRRAFEAGEPLHQVFVTVSATLKEQVCRAFSRLRAGLPAVTPDRAAAYAAAAAVAHHSFRGLPDEAWPLFLSAKQYQHMLDGTLRQPFFKRRHDGSFFFESEARDDDDGMSMMVDLGAAAAAAAAAAGAAGDPGSAAASEAGASGAGGEEAGEGRPAAEEGARLKVTYSMFQAMFRRLVGRAGISRTGEDVSASLVWQEIVSYIKGTRQAVEGSGALTEEQYLSDIGRKQAPNFGRDARVAIYRVFQEYEVAKRQAVVEGHAAHFLYDAADVVAHMHRQLAKHGYRGDPIHELDEVQDFTQAELLLGLKVVADPNGLFLCGDTCQTIARGIGFRFTDVKQLFYEAQREACERRGLKEGGGAAAGAASGVAMPDIAVLATNYRTHSGVLDVAAAVVGLLKRFFAEHIDALEPEQAFLEAPHLPLLLGAATPGNVAMLLSGGDAGEAWKTEFGANQVVLRRSLASAVPPFLRKVDAVVMTVPQAKGLEFNDVFILDFFADSPCKEEWRVLMQHLAELEELGKRQGPGALPFGKPLEQVTPAELGFSGARLAALPFDEAQHKLLCEELKHLYTAVTRAKNAVVFFDSDPQSHAPFYFLLARLGLARVVTGPLKLEEGRDLHQLGMSKAKSTPQDWIRRAHTMVRTRNYEAAATCFRKAGNGSRAAACQAQAQLQAATQLEEEASGQGVEAQQRALRFDAGYSLLGTAVNAPPQEADPAERREWLLLAAAALRAAGEEAAAAQISGALGPAVGRAGEAAVVGRAGVRGGSVRTRG